MRDPEGRLTFVGDRAVRHLTNPGLRPDSFLQSSAAGRLTDDGILVPFRITPSGQIESPRYGFVTHPTEWSDLQHYDAARLTLAVAQRVLKDGYELKDASAWNIVFEGKLVNINLSDIHFFVELTICSIHINS